MSLLKLPSELVICIASFLETENDVSCCARTCRWLFSILNNLCYERNRLYGKNSALIWAAKYGVPQTLYRAREAGTVPTEEDLNLVHEAAEYGQEQIISVLVGEFGFGHSDLDDEDATPLHIASQNSKPQAVSVLLKLGADPSLPGLSGETPLHEAVYANDMETAAMLLSAGADTSSRMHELHDEFPGQTPLHIAVGHSGSCAMVELLVKHGADINAQCEDGLTPVFRSIDRGDQSIIKYLVNEGADLSISTTKYRIMQPIHAAVEANLLDVIDLLLNHGADVNMRSGEGWTPVEYAVQLGLFEMTALLLTKGADMHGSQSDDWEMISTAVENGDARIVKLLLEAGADVNDASSNIPLLAQACSSGHEELVPILLQHGADASFVDEHGNGLMNFAAAGGHTAVIATLLKNTDLDPSLGNNNGLNALHLASDGGHLDTARLLIESHVDVSSLDRNHNTPLQSAANAGRMDVLKLLLDTGADPRIPNIRLTTPLLTASGRGHTNQISLLLEKDVDPCFLDDQKRTPLFLASWNGKIEAIKLLLSHPTADIQLTLANKNGYTPLLAAISSNQLETARLLLENGADIGASNCTGAGPLIVAAEQGNANMIDALLATNKLDINQQDINGRTALFFATMFGRAAAVDVLLSHQPPPASNLQDRYGATPLIMAARTGRAEILESLLGLDDVPLETHDIFAHNVFYWAATSVNSKVVSLLAPFDRYASMKVDVNDGFEEPGSRSDACCCDVCGRSTTGASATQPPAYSCRMCHVGNEEEFICCHYCVKDGAKCRDSSHVWEPHNCECDEEDEDEDGDGEGEGEESAEEEDD